MSYLRIWCYGMALAFPLAAVCALAYDVFGDPRAAVIWTALGVPASTIVWFLLEGRRRKDEE